MIQTQVVLASLKFFGRPKLALDAVGGQSAARLVEALAEVRHCEAKEHKLASHEHASMHGFYPLALPVSDTSPIVLCFRAVFLSSWTLFSHDKHAVSCMRWILLLIILLPAHNK